MRDIIDISSSAPKTFGELLKELGVGRSSLTNALRSIIQGQSKYGSIACRLEVVGKNIVHKYQYDSLAPARVHLLRNLALQTEKEKGTGRVGLYVVRRRVRKDGSYHVRRRRVCWVE